MSMKLKLSIIILLLAIVFSACQNGGGANIENPAANDSKDETEIVTEYYLDILPADDFGGYTFTVVGYHTSDRVSFPEESETGEPLNDSLYRRNKMLEERFNINIVNIPFPDREPTTQAVRKSVMAQDNAYDLIVHSLGYGLNYLSMEGSLYNLNKIDYLQLDKDWWCKFLYEDLNVKGNIFYSSGSMMPFFFGTPVVLYFNKKLADDYDFGDLYKLVFDYEWTADKFAELIKDKNKDIDGDGVMNKNNDFFGLASDLMAASALPAAFGQKMVARDKDTYFKLNFENEMFINAVNKTRDLINDPASTYNGAVKYVQYDENAVFFEDRLIFTIATSACSYTSYRTMESNFGILPLPMLTAAQKQYYSYGTPYGPVGAGVPSYCENPARTGMITEAMAFLSYEMVRPVMYDTILHQKGARDEQSQRILDIVFSAESFDLNQLHDFGGSCTLLNAYAFDKKGDLVSGYTAIKDKAEKEIGTLITAYLELN